MTSERPNGQKDVEDVIVEVLEHRSTMTTAEVTRAVKARIQLVAADLKRAARRDNETKIDQIIANALQSGRRICRDGLIERVGHGEFRITAAGRDYLAKRRILTDNMLKRLAEMFPDEDWE